MMIKSGLGLPCSCLSLVTSTEGNMMRVLRWRRGTTRR